MAIRKDKREQQIKKKRQGLVGSCISNGNDAFTGFEGVFPSQDDRIYAETDGTTEPNASNPSDRDIHHFKSILLSHTSSLGEIIEATKGIRRLLSVERNPFVAAILDQGVLPILVRNLKSDDDVLVFESAWAITNIAATDRTKDVSDTEATPLLISLMTHKDANVREQAIWCLGNIAGESSEMRDDLLRKGIVSPL